MIVATAGHVDHGKTSLIKALTGVDTDRLEEEKRRGMSIDLGFAYADLGGDLLAGFVDVPGHERFLRNMLAGVAGVDCVLLVVAADDGLMPQTLEHLAIVELLGLSRGVVALTKTDRVAPARVDAATQAVRARLQQGTLAQAEIIPVSSVTGEGIDRLRAALRALNAEQRATPDEGNFRLAIDRCFTREGAGLVVTGVVMSGSVAAGDMLTLSPHGIPVRARGLHVHNKSAPLARAGQRCAINLAGTELRRAAVHRGDWLVAPRAHLLSDRFDVDLTLLPGDGPSVRHWTPVQLHVGAAAVSARVALAAGTAGTPGMPTPALAPGTQGVAQLVTDTPIPIAFHDRIILRDPAAHRTLGAARVVQPFGTRQGRGRPTHQAMLTAMREPSHAVCLARLLADRPEGLSLMHFSRSRNLAEHAAQAAVREARARSLPAREDVLLMAESHWQALKARLLDSLAAWHRAEPAAAGASEAALAARIGAGIALPLLQSALHALVDEGAMHRSGPYLRLADHRPVLNGADAALLDRLRQALVPAGLRPPIIGELAQTLRMPQPALIAVLQRITRQGHLVQVAPNRWFLPETVGALADIARALSREAGGDGEGYFDAAAFRDRTGIGRNLSIEVLEYLDRIGVTRFAGGKRKAIL